LQVSDCSFANTLQSHCKQRRPSLIPELPHLTLVHRCKQ